MIKARRSARTFHKGKGISTVVGAIIIAVMIFIVAFTYFGFELNQRSALEQAANQAGQLNQQASQEILNANGSLDASGNLLVNITDSFASTPVEIVDVIVGAVTTNNVIQDYKGLQIGLNPGNSYLFDTTVQYTIGNPLWAKVVTSLGTTVVALYPYPSYPTNPSSSSSGKGFPAGNLFDIQLNFSSFSWYSVVTCTPDNPQESSYCLSPATGAGNDANTIYTSSTSQPLAFTANVMDVNPQQKNITLDPLTVFLEFQSCGSSICAYHWFISSNLTALNSNGQMANHLMNSYQPITLNYGQPVTLVFSTASHQPKCTTNCYPVSSYAPVPSYTPIASIAANLIFAQGWEGIKADQPVNYGQNLPFTSTLYITPSITLSPTGGLVGTIVTVSGTSFTASSTVTITYAGTVVATTTASLSGTFSTTFVVPQSTGTNVVTATDSYGVSASANYVVSDFSITANPATLATQIGTTSTDTITVTSLSGFTGTVALSITSVSPATGLSATLSTGSVNLGASGTATLTVTPSVYGTYVVNITGTSGGVSHSVNVTVIVSSLSITPTSGYPSSVITLSGSSYSPQKVYSYCLSTSATSINCVTGTASGFSSSPTGGIPSGTNFTVPLGTTTGTLYVIVYNSTTINSVADFDVQDFSLSSTTTTASVSLGSNATFSITVSSLNGFAGNVTLSSSNNSTCTGCSSLSSSYVVLTANAQDTITLQFMPPAAGTYSIIVTGTYHGDTHSIKFTVTAA